ncbi:hypothetical protein RRG08_058290 [Elysia crispata]|uniref:Transmembrane protein n=1 Tax=Elysia crispata TaxID=231223 RepID=A0AAE0YWT0_9GAST|nr:hypothetical protein RRG08_058290 [Elysia crispata]
MCARLRSTLTVHHEHKQRHEHRQLASYRVIDHGSVTSYVSSDKRFERDQLKSLHSDDTAAQMASFHISALDILKISLSAHAFLLLRSVLGKVVDCLLPLLSPFSMRLRALHRLHERTPHLLPRVFSEQASLLVLTIVSLVALSHTSVSLIPFGYQPQPRPDFLIRVVLTACVARYMVMMSWLLLGREVTLRRTGSETKATISTAAGESGSHIWDSLYFIVCAGTTLLSLGYRQNLLLAMTLPFQELDTVFSGCCTLTQITAAMKAKQQRISSAFNRPLFRTTRGCSLVSCIICFVCRAVLPTLFLALALQKESPLVMDWLPLAWFFLSSAFLSTFHIVMIYHKVLSVTNHGTHTGSVKHGKKKSWETTLIENLDSEDMGLGITQEGMQTLMARRHRGHSLSTHNHSHSLTNDIYQDIVLEKQDINKCRMDRLRDLNYGLLRPCDNRNISSCAGDSEYREANEGDERRDNSVASNVIAADKINVVRKKDMSKTWLLYRLLANSLSSSPPLSTSSLSSSVPSDALNAGEGVGDISELQPWMFPALFDASSNTKLHCQTPVVHTKHDPQKYLENVDGTNSHNFQCHSGETQALQDSRSRGPWQTVKKQVTQKSNHSARTEEHLSMPLPFDSATRGDSETPAEIAPESYNQSKDDVHLDFKFSTNKSESHTKPSYKGRHKLSSDCVQLLNGSKESLNEAFAQLGKGFSAV